MNQPSHATQAAGHDTPTAGRPAAWWQSHLSPGASLSIASVIIGTGAGIATFLLKFLIGRLSGLFSPLMRPDAPNWWLLAVPVAGIILSMCYQRYWLHCDLMHGESRLDASLRARRYAMSPRLIYAPLVASTLTLGMGGSAGAEGPSAVVGGAIGSNLAGRLGMSQADMGLLVSIGAGAGIAGIFKAPIGGALFTLEVLRAPFTTISAVALVLAALCSAMTCYALTGFSLDITYLPTQEFAPAWLGWIVLLGVFCGLYSLYYTEVMRRMRRFFGNISSPWLMSIAGGGLLAVCIFLFPILFGEGYGVVTAIINDDFSHLTEGSVLRSMVSGPVALLIFVALALLAKCWACVSSNSAGGVAGDFAPTIFAGALGGYLFASGVNLAFGTELPVGVFALLGTAGVFAGVIHAPLMAIFLTAEMTACYHYFMGLSICAIVAYLVVKFLAPGSKSPTFRHDDLEALRHSGQH